MFLYILFSSTSYPFFLHSLPFFILFSLRSLISDSISPLLLFPRFPCLSFSSSTFRLLSLSHSGVCFLLYFLPISLFSNFSPIFLIFVFLFYLPPLRQLFPPYLSPLHLFISLHSCLPMISLQPLFSISLYISLISFLPISFISLSSFY